MARWITAVIVPACLAAACLLFAVRASAVERPAVTNDLNMTFVYIPPGTFAMGSPPSEPGRDGDEGRHTVTLTRGFYMQTTEVTQGQWKQVTGKNPSRFTDLLRSHDDWPVECVSWNDVQEFIRKLNCMDGREAYRLPTEAEWEYACRAGTLTAFAFGACLSTDQANVNGQNAVCDGGLFRRTTMRVGSFPPNAWGLYDMHGNVNEWCRDVYDTYPPFSVTDPRGGTCGSYRILRGGGWYDEARHSRSAYRGRHFPGLKSPHNGFRLVLDVQP
ncbi:formylglycine-generating enzyme family protein [Desulfatiferula olefinivorans]